MITRMNFVRLGACEDTIVGMVVVGLSTLGINLFRLWVPPLANPMTRLFKQEEWVHDAARRDKRVH